MKNITRLIVALIVWLQTSVSSFAIQVTSVSAQSSQVEGQSVEITAAVLWENPAPGIWPANSPTAPRFSVTAQAGGQTISMVFDSALGRYRGQFQGLLFDRHTAIVTATRTTLVFGVIPPSVKKVSAAGQVSFLVGPAPGCFNFIQSSSLQGWTTSGFFDGGVPTIVAPMTSTLSWEDRVGFLSFGVDNNGALLLNLSGNSTIQSTSFPSGFWSFDFRSPDLTANPDWQGISGVSFRMAAQPLAILDIQPLLRVRRPDGTITFFRAEDSQGNPVFQKFLSGEFAYRVMKAEIPIPSGCTVMNVYIRVFGQVTERFPDALVLDGVCPKH